MSLAVSSMIHSLFPLSRNPVSHMLKMLDITSFLLFIPLLFVQ